MHTCKFTTQHENTCFLTSIKLNKVKKASIYKTTLEELQRIRSSM